MASNQRVAVVTGSSSGIGHETSLTLARNGFLTYATMRNLPKGENTKSLAEKVNKDFGIDNAVILLIKRHLIKKFVLIPHIPVLKMMSTLLRD